MTGRDAQHTHYLSATLAGSQAISRLRTVASERNREKEEREREGGRMCVRVCALVCAFGTGNSVVTGRRWRLRTAVTGVCPLARDSEDSMIGGWKG